MSQSESNKPFSLFSLDHCGEFDELWAANSFVHVERMDVTAFWIGIDSPGLPRIMINTGVQRGTWYFSVQEDKIDGQSLQVQRPRRPSMEPPRWSSKKLDALMSEFEDRLKSSFASGGPEETAIAEVLGHWMYKLKECRK